VACAVILATAVFPAEGGNPFDEISEYQVKAAFLFEFAKFVEWPASTFSTDHSPVSICVLGDNPFSNSLEKAVAGQFANGRPLVVRHVPSPKEAGECQMVFVSRSQESHFIQIIENFQGKSVLTVADTNTFAEEGGMIQFYLENEHVRFEVNVGACTNAHLKISSKMLALAKIVSSGANNTGEGRN
jgi:hypothetical protein